MKIYTYAIGTTDDFKEATITLSEEIEDADDAFEKIGAAVLQVVNVGIPINRIKIKADPYVYPWLVSEYPLHYFKMTHTLYKHPWWHKVLEFIGIECKPVKVAEVVLVPHPSVIQRMREDILVAGKLTVLGHAIHVDMEI